MEENITIALPASLAEAFGAPRALVYYEELVEGAIVHSVWDGERKIRLTDAQRAGIEVMVVEHMRATRSTYTEARHGKARDAARPNRPDQRWAGMKARARRSA